MSKRAPKTCDGCGFPRNACQCLELALLFQVRAAGLPEPVRQFPFAHPRRYRSDFAWPDERLLVECDGMGANHMGYLGYSADCEKHNLAMLLGWRVLRFTRLLIDSGEALTTIERALGRTT